jgi:hypothetical protein
MKKKAVLSRFNYWSKKVSKKFARSAQAVLSSKGVVSAKTVAAGASSCGQGQCNCGGGCNGECATSCEA